MDAQLSGKIRGVCYGLEAFIVLVETLVREKLEDKVTDID